MPPSSNSRNDRRGYDPETLSVGILGRPHGVTGELALRTHNRATTALDGVDSLLLVKDGRTTEHALTAIRPVADGFLIRLEGIESREAAAALTLSEVRVPRAGLPPPEPGEYYVDDIIGCAVTREGGEPLGVVRSTFWNGAHDVAIVFDAAGRERMIPLVPDFVVAVDTAARTMEVRWEDVDE